MTTTHAHLGGSETACGADTHNLPRGHDATTDYTPEGPDPEPRHTITCGACRRRLDMPPIPLTRTQKQAAEELSDRGMLWPIVTWGSISHDGARYTRRTLDAIVQAGLAEWSHRDGVMPHIVPVVAPSVITDAIVAKPPRQPDVGDDPGNYTTVTLRVCLPCAHGDHHTCYGEGCQCACAYDADPDRITDLTGNRL